MMATSKQCEHSIRVRFGDYFIAPERFHFIETPGSSTEHCDDVKSQRMQGLHSLGNVSWLPLAFASNYRNNPPTLRPT